MTLTVDGATGLLKSVTVDGKTQNVKQEFLWYKGKSGGNSNANDRASGAYIFRPDGEEALAIPSTGIITTVYRGLFPIIDIALLSLLSLLHDNR